MRQASVKMGGDSGGEEKDKERRKQEIIKSVQKENK